MPVQQFSDKISTVCEIRETLAALDCIESMDIGISEGGVVTGRVRLKNREVFHEFNDLITDRGLHVTGLNSQSITEYVEGPNGKKQEVWETIILVRFRVNK